jgi:hypothetical protein
MHVVSLNKKILNKSLILRTLHRNITVNRKLLNNLEKKVFVKLQIRSDGAETTTLNLYTVAS